jgi:hypothetical protein
MKNIFVLPTDKPSRLHNKNGELGNYPSTKLYIEDFKGNQHNSFHIYITSDDEIKEGDWYFLESVTTKNMVLKANESKISTNCNKIILTTDQDLIKDGVQAIDDDFLEWFIKNPSCEKVEVRKIGEEWIYNADVPKEETKTNLEKDIFENLKEYYKNIPREKVLEDWNKSAHLDNVGPTVEEFIENSNKEIFKNLKTISSKDIDPEFVDIVNDSFWELIDDNEERLENIFHEIDDKLVRYSTEESEYWHHYKIGVLDGLKWQEQNYDKKYSEQDMQEAGEKWVFETNDHKWSNNDDTAGDNYGSFIQGAKWQAERMFTYDELRQIAYNAYCLGQLEEPTENKYNLWIQQFKNK